MSTNSVFNRASDIVRSNPDVSVRYGNTHSQLQLQTLGRIISWIRHAAHP